METRSWALGNAIRSARMKRGYTQEQLSELLDITPGHLQQMEGGRRNPSVPLLLQMMELLDFSVDALVFPARAQSPVLHTDGLTERETEALERLIDAMKEK
ncbi:MAG: helix-turn-helix domain-containing protein [Oscillospiraceae bacterium]